MNDDLKEFEKLYDDMINLINDKSIKNTMKCFFAMLGVMAQGFNTETRVKYIASIRELTDFLEIQLQEFKKDG